ncbi:major facilitator superfamily domain-containing protein [Paraphysoderma sedebokerense]|nr:major facilitator superfamily domain-containing protein [Paraphysoderma sedebokerense]
MSNSNRRRLQSPSNASPLLLKWQKITLLCLIAVTISVYHHRASTNPFALYPFPCTLLSRTNLSIALPTILYKTKIEKSEFGSVISFGYAFYAVGKLVNGALIDVLGGRRMLCYCLLGSILCTIAFGSIPNEHASVGVFTFIWSSNRIFQSAGWPAITTIIPAWFPPESHGKTMGLTALSYSLGDAGIRFLLGKVLSYPNVTWQQIFYLSAMCGFILLVPSLIYLYDAPTSLELPDPNRTHSISLTNISEMEADASSRTRSRSNGASALRNAKPVKSNPLIFIKNLYAPLAKLPKFYLLMLLAPIFTWCREIFNSWIVVFIFETFHVSESAASIISLAFPLLSSVSLIVGGFMIDYFGRRYRGAIFFVTVALTFLTFIVFASYTHKDLIIPTSPQLPTEHLVSPESSITAKGVASPDPPNHSLFPIIVLVSLSALFSTAPASFADGIFIMELASSTPGVKQGAVVGAVHCSGYIGAIAAGKFVGNVVEQFGWGQLFKLMSTAMGVATGLSAIYWWVDYKGALQEEEQYARLVGEDPEDD